MAHAERHDRYLRPTLITPDYTQEESNEETKRPRLTLRYLNELIEDIHAENGKLADQIDTLSNQLDELARKLDALDIWKDDGELAAGLDGSFVNEETAAPPISVPQEAEAADGSEAFAKEWALIQHEESHDAGGISMTAAAELPASLQERMIENVKEAARIAEEIAAQASAHAEARAAEHESASFAAIPPAIEPRDADMLSADWEAAAAAPEPPSDADSTQPPPVADSPSAIEAVPESPRMKETVFRYESAVAAHSYIPPRSERHASTKKRSLWSRLFARESI